jgi:uncharacterized protein involved in exopolysaccharide biosynthesis
VEYESKSLKDYFAIIKRRKFIIVFSLVVVSVIGVALAYSIPSTYRSTSRFLIEQQDIPRDIVQSTITSYVDEQIQEVRQRVMSSANLITIIENHGLYEDIRASGSIQAALEVFRANTFLETEVFDVMNPRSGRAMLATISFTLSFDHSDAETAHAVAEDLAELYLAENIESRTGQVQETLQFILSDIERYSQDVEHTGALLADFKERNLGNLPELLTYNLQTIERTEREIGQIDRDIRESRNRQLQFSAELARLGPAETVYDVTGAPIVNPTEQLALLQREKMRLLSIYSEEHPDVVKLQKEIDALNRVAAGDVDYLSNLEIQVDAARVELARAQERYSDTHPDVARAKRSLENLEDELARARTADPQTSGTSETNPYAKQLQARVDAEASSIAALRKRKLDLQQKLTELESKVALSPQVEREYAVLKRDNETAIANLNDARAKFDEAQKAEKLESGGSGDRFTIIEPARVPVSPYKPNRPAIILLGIVLAAGIGLVLATVVDTFDETVKSSRDVLRLIGAPPLAVVPYLESDAEQRHRFVVNISMVALVAAGAVISYFISILAA